jgi:hypothetical protein
MAKKYKSRKSRRCRSKKGGRLTLLGPENYPGNNTPSSWNTSVTPGTTASAASAFKTFLGGFSQGSPSQNSSALNNFATTGNGQGTQSGGGRSKRRGKRGMKVSKRITPKSFGESNAREHQMAQGLTQAQAQAQAAAMQQSQSQSQQQTGGMFASFGSLLKEALVPLGLLAAQQVYAKSYGKKTRKNRR